MINLVPVEIEGCGYEKDPPIARLLHQGFANTLPAAVYRVRDGYEHLGLLFVYPDEMTFRRSRADWGLADLADHPHLLGRGTWVSGKVTDCLGYLLHLLNEEAA
jgi:hypothetical protein